MVDKPYETLIKSGEASRFGCFMLEKFDLPPAAFKGNELRDTVVREMKNLRLKVGSKDLSIVPRPLLSQCHVVLRGKE